MPLKQLWTTPCVHVLKFGFHIPNVLYQHLSFVAML